MPELIPSLEELKDLLAKNKAKKLSKNLAIILTENKENIGDFYNLLVELIKHNSANFFRNCYFRIKNEASKIISATALHEMDKYFLDNYAFSEVEKLLTSFRGVFKLPKAKLTGFLYLTKFRILGDGFLEEKGKSAPGMGPKSLVGVAVEMRREAQRNAIKKALIAALGDKFTEDALAIFPYNYPVMDAYNIKKSNKSISYTVTIRYQTKKGKEKEEVLTFEVIPKKEKSETADSYNSRKEQILNAIEEVLLKAQTS
ncbi:MAG: hypothetical protein ACFE9Z_13575 [Promethearchaeota archaeon]